VTKAKTKKEEITETAPLYDKSTDQIIGLTIDGEIQVTHTIKPLSDTRYLQLLDALEESTPTETRDLQSKLWAEICPSGTGYAERPEWQSGVPLPHRIATMEAYLLSIPGIEKTKTSVFDIDAPRTIELRAVFGDTELATLKIAFRHPTQAEIEEYLLLQNDEPNPADLASAAKVTKSERKAKLAKRLKISVEGYAGEPPMWHMLTALDTHLAAELLSAKKSLLPSAPMPKRKS